MSPDTTKYTMKSISHPSMNFPSDKQIPEYATADVARTDCVRCETFFEYPVGVDQVRCPHCDELNWVGGGSSSGARAQHQDDCGLVALDRVLKVFIFGCPVVAFGIFAWWMYDVARGGL